MGENDSMMAPPPQFPPNRIPVVWEEKPWAQEKVGALL